MSKEGDRQSVFRSTKIRTALKGDSSWIQRGNPPEQEEEDEKPWLAEVRARRLNSDFTEPIDNKTPPEPETQPSASVDSNSKSSGYLIRGVFTKTDTKAASSSSNGYMGSSGFVKKSSEGYKKIAPHTVRSTVEKTETLEPSLSSDEQEKRTMAASKTLNSSAGRQKSYVMSAAKKYESTPGTTDSPASSTTEPAFIAKRVVIGEEDDTGSFQPSTRVSPPKQSVEMSVDELTTPESSSKLKTSTKSEPTTKQSDTKSTFSDTLLSTTESISKKTAAEVRSPVPETKTVSKPEPSPTKTSTVNEKVSQATPVAPVAPVTTLKKSATPEPKPDSTLKASTTEPVAPAIPAVKDIPSKTPETKPKAETTPKPSITPKPVEKTSALNDNDLLDLTGSAPGNLVDPMPPSTDLLTGGVLPKTEKAKKSLDLLADDIIPFDTSTDKLSSDKTSTKIEISKTVVQTKKDVKSTSMTLVDPVPTTTDLLAGRTKTEKTKGSLDLLTDDMLQFDNKPSTDKTTTKTEISQTVQTKKDVKSTPMTLVDPVPSTTDLLPGRTKTEKTKGSLDLLTDDMLQFDNNTNKPSTDKTSTKTEISQTVQTKKDVKSTPMTLVDPVPTTTDLLAGGSLPKTKKTTETLDLLADDIIPFDTNKDRLSTDKTRSKVETTTTVIETKTVKTSSDDPFDPFPIVRESTKSSVEFFDPPLSDSRNGQQQTVSVTYKQTRSTKTSSPWDKWEVPPVDITQEESEPKPEPEPVDDSYSSYTITEESSFSEPDKTKKNVVYVKSYVNSSEPPRYSSSRYDTDYDYVTSSSSSYAYSSPSSMVTMTSCTYCGKLVGSDSKITIDHLNISCHPECFKCAVCSKPMGDFLHSMFLHRGMVHCENCYSNVI
ncbi:zinc finger protein 185 isoform X1 [Clarias gariepinus]|uniref:zinc finger protein 185 isoform X1 n=1 Tax=Clarias gariepinus TaxID=13013 RepID=UPI00234CE4A4|nr:zinc finger protein 185 isoform X1 [Clarias gariepinus]